LEYRDDKVECPKKTGIHVPLDISKIFISNQLAKTIGTAKREQIAGLQDIRELWAHLWQGEDQHDNTD
jgi:hypothetical protein